MTYSEITRLKEETKVIILSAPDYHERWVFYDNPFSTRHEHIVVKQRIDKNRRAWRNTEGWDSDIFAIQHGGKIVSTDRGNLKYRELIDKGYIRLETTLDKV